MNAIQSTTIPGIDALVGRSITDVERALILETLRHCLGNRTRAANVLRISIRTLRNRINKYASEGVYVPMAFQAKKDGALGPEALKATGFCC
jgi:two-component system response regulator FlrC